MRLSIPPATSERPPETYGDERTAAAFASSWNSVGSVYTHEQFVEWMAPVDPASIRGLSVLEMGFGNGSLLVHMGGYEPIRLSGIELGDTLARTEHNLRGVRKEIVDLHRGDLTTANLGQFDLVYCIGVLHHLDDPRAGFESVLRHTRPGGRFHCWVYAQEGNGIVIRVVDPIRRVVWRWPWWATKYAVALPLAVPFFAYAKAVHGASAARPSPVRALANLLPLAEYSRWIAQRDFRFFHHIAFDQLVTPQTRYIPRSTIEAWLEHASVDANSAYIVRRNGNSWKFGGRKKRE